MVNLSTLPRPVHRTAVAVGYFDGMHKGHLSVLETALDVSREQGLVPVILTFDMSRTRAAGKGSRNLFPDSFRDRKAEELGFSYCVTLDFGRIAPMDEETFVRDVIRDGLNAACVICGCDFRYGNGRTGDVASLTSLCASMDIGVKSVSQVTVDGIPVATSVIKELLENGEVEKANRMLGYEYPVHGTVTHGNHIAHSLGFPTANLDMPADLVCPAKGAYFSLTEADGSVFRSVTNIGTRPTVTEDLIPTCETHILDFSGDLYGKEITVRLLQFLRPEQHFGSLDELIDAVNENVEYARNAIIP